MDIKKIIGVKNYKTKRKMAGGGRMWYIKLPTLVECRTRWGILYNDDKWEWEILSDETDSDSDDDEKDNENDARWE